MIKRHLLQPMIPGTIHPLHHQLSLHPRLDPYLLNPFHHALQLPMMDSSSFEKRINNSSERQSSSNYNNNNNRTPGSRPLRSFLIEDILKHSPKRSQVPSSAAATAETVVSGATSLSCDSPPLPASIRKNHRASSDRDSQDSTSNTANQASIKNPKKEPESASSTPSPKSSSTTSSEYYNHNLAATPRETTHKLPSLPDTKGKDPNLLCNPLSSIDGKDVVWPAWVYCTRYSDRPSSGPRSRRSKKAKAEKKAADEKRPRTAFTAEQLARLKQEFQENKYLTEKRRQDLARDLKLNESQIKIWFQNKRAKIKKTAGSRNILALHLMAQGLYNHSTASCDDEDEEMEDVDMEDNDVTRTSE